MRRIVAIFRGTAIILGIVAVVAVALGLWAGPPFRLAGLGTAATAAVLVLVFLPLGRRLGRLDYSDLIGDDHHPATGLAATGRIVSVSRPGARLQRSYFMHRIEVAVDDGAGGERLATTRLALRPAALGHLKPGTAVPLRIDPRDARRVALDLAQLEEVEAAAL